MSNGFPLQIVTPDGLLFSGEAEKLIVRTVSGDVCILPQHCNYLTALGMGEARVFVEGNVRYAACMGGMLAVLNGSVRLVPTTFEWAEDLDTSRLERILREVPEQLEKLTSRPADVIAQDKARLKRAQVRYSVVQRAKAARAANRH